MNDILWKRLGETIMVGMIGGFVFAYGSLPLPWIIGPMIAILLWQGLTNRNMYCPGSLKNGSLLTLGVFFGLYFTVNTLKTVGPYFLPYVLMTAALIFVSVFNSSIVTKWIEIDKITSAFGTIPGGLTEMVIASESLKANSSLVAIFQTVRLLTVLFLVPFIIFHAFSGEYAAIQTSVMETSYSGSGWAYLWYLVPGVIGYHLRNAVPAGILILPLVVTAVLNISPAPLASLPPLLLTGAQLIAGICLGKSISFQDLKSGGKYCFVYFALTLVLIFVSFGLGTILAMSTPLSLPTAILSVAPGGLLEMVLTAAAVGGDPAVVSALQLVRFFLIVVFVPPVLKWYFRKRNMTSAA
ncbi:hypothetical protein SAMN05421736_104179 [Evansella caseinilytica]|uniref:AbrB family transcriptional regulator n=1 Tax=Evansella caseinilytica TaxID=1503961 RepID=A0A1H3NTX6_9BACI|nr:AbrB family transcriptional regulator [Evansella caseinilytica]SDY91599.1 hypothetical protein SAMN05421736_104179 [Evansella caseinilytica]